MFNLNDHMRSILWMIMACFSFACMIVLVRYISDFIHAFEMVFFRNFFAVLLFIPGIMWHGIGHIKTKAVKLHVFRGFTGVIGMFMWFYALTIMPVNQATAISFIVPIITALLAIMYLKESVSWHQWGALIAGFFGVLVVLRPGVMDVSVGAIWVLIATLTWSLSNILIKKLTASEHPRTIAFYLTLFMVPMSLPMAIPVWEWPTVEGCFWLLMLAISGNVAQISLAHAYSKVEMAEVLPFDFSRLVFVSIFAYILFGEVLDIWTVVGAIVIISSSVYVARRSARLRRKLVKEISF